MIEYALYDYLDRPINDGGYHRYVRSYENSGYWYEKYYAVNGTLTSEWEMYPNTEKWKRIDTWRQRWENSRASLPIRLDDYTQVTAISLSGNICTVTLRINLSKYDLSGADIVTLEDDGKEYAKLWREDSKMPRYVALVLVGMDNANRELYRIRY